MVTASELEKELKDIERKVNEMIKIADNMIKTVDPCLPRLKYPTSPRLKRSPVVREDATRFSPHRDGYGGMRGPGPKPKKPDRRAYLLDEKTVSYADFQLPVRNSTDGTTLVNLLNNFMKDDKHAKLRKNFEELVIDYFSKKRRTVRKAYSNITPREGLFKIISVLDPSYTISNKITHKLYKMDPYGFARTLRERIENNNQVTKAEPQDDSHSQKYVWDKTITLSYNPKEGFKTEDPADMERFSFLEDIFNCFLRDKKEIFDKLKSNAKLKYSLSMLLLEDGFNCYLKEKSVVEKAYHLNKELNELEDKPKELADKIDELQKISKEIFSKFSVHNIEDILPLFEHTKSISDFKFSEEDMQAYFFTNLGYKSHWYDTQYFCIFFSEDYKLKDNKLKLEEQDIKIEYFKVDRNRIEEALDFMRKKGLIDFDLKVLSEELKRIESDAFIEQFASFDRPKTDSERLLKLKDVSLPQKWYDLRDAYYDWKFKSKELLHFVLPRQKFSPVVEILDDLDIESEKV